MGRGVEDGILSYIIDNAKRNNVEEIKAEFIQTTKNKPAENFLRIWIRKTGNYWNYKLNNNIEYPNHLKVEVE